MILFGAVLAGLAALWGFTRVVTFVIDRRLPPLGRFITVEGVRVHMLDIPARPGAPVLLLIHGASGNLREPLEAVKDALGGRYRIIAMDRPGHGHSSRGGRDMADPGRQADIVAGVLTALDSPPAIVFGHSWGAAVAAATAVRHPGRVAGLVLLAAATHPWPGGVSARNRLFALPYIGAILAEFLVIPIGLALVRPAVRAIFAPAPVPPDYARRIGALLAIRPKTFVATCRDIADLNANLARLSRRYPEIGAPTVVITGDRDPVVAPSIHSKGLERDIPGARLVILPGAGHMPHWSRTAEVVQAIEQVRVAATDLRAGSDSRLSVRPYKRDAEQVRRPGRSERDAGRNDDALAG